VKEKDLISCLQKKCIKMAVAVIWLFLGAIMSLHCKILVVDDEPIVGERIKAAVEKSGHNVETFSDPAEALRRMETKDFDIVISDLRMGEIDGIQVMEKVFETSPNAVVIMITGYATLELARESLTKGAFDFIAKPFKLKEIRRTMQKAVDHLEQKQNRDNVSSAVR
jgi:DNA-binding NtrC family response regulator